MAYSKALAKTYATNREKYQSSDHYLAPFLKKTGIKGKVILDFGCGDGPEAVKFLSAGAAMVVGTDPSAEMIRLAKLRKLPRSRFIKNDGKKLPLKSNQFDLVYARYVLHYIRSLTPQFVQIHSVLKPKGYFIALFQCLTDDPKLRNKRVPITLGKGKEITKIKILSKSIEEVRTGLEKAGLEILTLSVVKNTDSQIDLTYEDRKKFKNVTYVLFAQKK